MTFSHVRVLTTGSDVLVPFYRDQLGVPVTWGEPGEDYVHFGAETTGEFSIFAPEHQIHARPGDDAFVMVFKSKDLSADVRALQSAGLEVSEIEDRPDWGIRVAYTRDPQGHLVEINESIPMVV